MPTELKTALVTGSGKRRVGYFVADALASRGYNLAIHYRTSASEAAESLERLRAHRIRAEGFRADLSDEGEVGTLVENVMLAFGRIDVLVNCAAIWQRKPFEEVTESDVRRHFEINTLGSFLCSQKVGLAMVRQPAGGAIILLGDWAASRPYLNYAAYFPSKGAIPTLTRSLAVELGTRNPRVRVNCILPGPVMLPADLPAAERAEAINATLVKHEGTPENIAQAAMAFIDNDFVTGACLRVDGGRSIYAP